MTKPKFQIKIVDCTTGEEFFQDATEEQIAQFKLNAENAEAEKVKLESIATQRQAILDRLGLTVDEAKLLLG